MKQGANIYLTACGAQKERLEPDDLFVLKPDGTVSQHPPEGRKLILSTVAPIFMNAYKSKSKTSERTFHLLNKCVSS